MVTQAFSCELHKASSLSHAAQHGTPKLGSFDPNSFLSPFFEGPARSFWAAHKPSSKAEKPVSVALGLVVVRGALRSDAAIFGVGDVYKLHCFIVWTALPPSVGRSPLKTPPKKTKT